MMDDQRKMFLLMRYLDGTLSQADAAAFNQSLREDAALRNLLNEIAWQATSIADIRRAAELKAKPIRSRTTPRILRQVFSRRSWLVAASLLLVFGIGALVWRSDQTKSKTATLVEITELSGAAIWTPIGGSQPSVPSTGDRVGSGVLQTEAETAFAQFRFDDGTTLTLVGVSEIVISEEDGRKVLYLKRGSLSAQVAKQPAGKPMLLHTPTALMEVLGTTFNVTTQAEQTQLSVAEGRVRMKRRVDGREVDVSARESADATLDPAGALATRQPSHPPITWRMTFDAPSDRLKGNWTPGTDPANPPRLAAVPYVAGRKDVAKMVVHRGVVLRAGPDQNAGAFATLTGESVVRIRYRSARTASLQALLITRKPDGGFGGNFERVTQSESTEVASDGWRIATMPLRTFRPLIAAHSQSIGREVVKVLVSTFEFDAGLEIAEVTVSPDSSTPQREPRE